LLLFSLFAHVWTFVMHSRSVLCMTGHYNFYYVCMYVCITVLLILYVIFNIVYSFGAFKLFSIEKLS